MTFPNDRRTHTGESDQSGTSAATRKRRIGVLKGLGRSNTGTSYFGGHIWLVALSQSVLAGKQPHNCAEAALIRVLVIDDDEFMREAIGYMLEELEIEFHVVSSGEEGLKRLSEQCYHLVLLDLVLCTGDHGVEIYKKLRDHLDGLMVVFITACGSKEPIVEDASKLGRLILTKPFSLCKLKQVIAEAN